MTWATSMPESQDPTQYYERSTPSSRATSRDPTRIGSFEVIERIGRGGMGVVYKARDPRLKRLVAIKMMLAAEHAEDDHLYRFRLEAEAVARLRHPNIVQVFEVGEQNGLPYIALEFIDGPTLATFVQGRPQPAQFSAELVEALAWAVQYAHAQGVIHRDLKPANILLDSGGDLSGDSSVSSAATTRQDMPQNPADESTVVAPTIVMSDASLDKHGRKLERSSPDSSASRADSSSIIRGASGHTLPSGLLPKITDFGLAKRLDTESELTATGDIVGTPKYMAPEQAALSKHAVGPASDVYSLGGILYFLITGRAPFHGATSIETLLMVKNDNPPAPTLLVPRLSRDLETICLKCLEKDPGRRYATAGDLAEELQRYQRGEPIHARPVSRVERSWRWCRRNPLVASLSAACVLIFVLGFAGVVWKWREASANLVEANNAKAKAISSQLAQQRQSSRILFNRGLELCAEGNANDGVHWLVESLRVAPDQPDDRHWREVIRVNLGGWSRHIRARRHWIELPRRSYARAFSPDGTMCVIGLLEGDMLRIDVATGKPIGTLIKLDVPATGWSGVWAVAFHPSGDWFLAAGGERATSPASTSGVVQRFDARTGEAIGQPITFPHCVDGVVISPDGTGYAVVYSQQKLQQAFVSILMTDDEQPVIDPTYSFQGIPRDLVFSLDGQHLLVGIGFEEGDPHTVASILDIDSREVIVEAVDLGGPSLVRHSAGGTSLTLDQANEPISFGWWRDGVSTGLQPAYTVVGPERRYAIRDLPPGVAMDSSAQAQSRATRPDPDTKQRRHTWHHFVAASPQHDSVIAGSEDGFARVIDVNSGCLRCRPLIHSGNVLAVTFSPDGSLCATATTSVQIWDVATGQPRGEPLPHSNTVSVMAFSPDGKTLAVGDYSTLVKLWDVDSGRMLEPALEQRDIVTCLAFSPDGRKLAVGTASDWNHDPQAKLWDVETHEPIGEPMKFGAYVRHVEFNHDGSRLLTASSDATVKIWDTTTAAQVGATIPYTDQLSTAIFSPDGATVLTGDESGDVQGWDTESGEPISGAVARGPSLVTAIAYDREGRRFAVGYHDGTSQLFDARGFRPLGPPAFQRSAIKKLFLSADGQSWTTILADGTPRTWQAPRATAGSANEIALRLQVDTGIAIDANQMRVELSMAQWKALRDRVRVGAEGTLSQRTRGDEDATWHEARARDAEEDGDWFAAQWHLDRLIKTAPENWVLYARRARSHSERGDFASAQADYSQARERLEVPGDLRRLILWYHQRSLTCRSNSNWQAALWYLDHLIKEDPNDIELQADRMSVEFELRRPPLLPDD